MIHFYFHPTPNPAKVSLFLEEAGLDYEVVPVDTSKGQQHDPAFRKINPNGKVPAIVDFDAMNGVYDAWIDPANPPARACVEARLADPDLRVEMTAVAAL